MGADDRINPLLDGADTGYGIRRQSIAKGSKIPNVAIFVKRTALEFLQILFSQREVGSLHYDQDPGRSDIIISDVHAVDLKTVGARPAIIAIRGPLSFQGMGLGGNALEKRDTRTGKYTFNDILTGSVAFNCISREGLEAEQIGHLVFNSFKFFQPVLRKLGFLSIKSLNIGGEALIEQEGGDDKTYLVPILLTVQVQDRWTLDSNVEKRLSQILIETLIG